MTQKLSERPGWQVKKAILSNTVGSSKILNVILTAGLIIDLGAVALPRPLPPPQSLKNIIRKIFPDIKPPSSSPLTKNRKPLFQPKSNVLIPLENLPSSSPFKIVRISVNQFYRGFTKGAKSPSHYLQSMRAKQPYLVDAWLKKPKSKRIFIIGAGEDLELAKDLSKGLRRDGYEPFFYRYCNPECDEEFIGAIMATAGDRLFLNTPSAWESRYVEVEVAAARKHLGYQKDLIVVIPGVEVLEGVTTSASSRLDGDRILSCESYYRRTRCLVAFE